MTRELTEYVCGRCGYAAALVTRRGATFWTHCVSGYGNRSCGFPPLLVKREDYRPRVDPKITRSDDEALRLQIQRQPLGGFIFDDSNKDKT